MIYKQIIECLVCKNHYGQNDKFISICPHCCNDDTKKTIYLSEESEMLKAYIDGEITLKGEL
jgi:hypothetical protein